MRILIVNYEYPPIGAGGGKASKKIAETLVEMGHTVRVVTAQPTQLYQLFGNLMLLAGVGFWIYLAYFKICCDEDISNHGFTILGTLLLLIGFILRNTALTWELTSPVRGLKALEFINGVEVRRVPVSRRRQDYSTILEMSTFVVSAAIYLLRSVSEFKPDIIHIFFAIPDGPIGWLLKRTHKYPYIISLRGADVPSDEVKRFARAYQVLRPIVAHLFQDADRVVSVSNGLRSYAHQISPNVPIDVVTNAIDLGRFTPPLNLNQRNCVRLIYVGRLAASKSPETLIKVAAALKKLDVAPFELELVGEGEQRALLEGLVLTYDLAKEVRFSGWVEHPALIEHYRNADIFVTATSWEGMPNTVLEAMAVGLPVVATHAPGLDQLVLDGRNGYLAPLGDVQTMTNHLRHLINNAHERQRMGKESRQRAAKLFSWDSITAQYVDIYKQIAKESSKKQTEN